MSPKEVWKKLHGFKNIEVSNLGKIRRLAYTVTTSSGYERSYSTKVLKPRVNNNSGLLVASVKDRNNRPKTVYIHKVVALLFVENKTPRKRKMVCHLDGNLTNNEASNLKWVTKKESVHNRYVHASAEERSKQGRRDPLNDELLQKALLIRKKTGKSWQKIALEIGCSASHLWKKMKEQAPDDH